MVAPKLPPGISLLVLREEIVYSLAACRSDLHAAPYVASFQALLDRWSVVFMDQLSRWDAQTIAAFAIAQADDGLDVTTSDFSQELLLSVNGDRSDPHYTHYFDVSPSRLVLPVLGPELETLHGWTGSLATETDPQLQPFAARFQTQLAEADTAVAQAHAADEENRRFREIGELAEFRKQVEQERDRVAAALEAGRVAHPELKLPRDYASRFFRHRRPTALTDDEKTARAAAREQARAARADLQAKKKAARDALRLARKAVRDLG
jgi:hypothetical protein